MYANVNIPREEDFLFLVTALWHWYQKYSPPKLELYNDPDEMEVVEVPQEEIEKRRKEAERKRKEEEEKKAQEEKRAKSEDDKKKADKAEQADKQELSDKSEIANTTWANLKESAMQENYSENS